MPDVESAAADEEGARALGLTGKVPFLWGLVAVVVVALGGAAAFVVLGAARGPRPAFMEGPGASAVAPGRVSPAPGTVAIAGSGSNLPVTRALVEALRGRGAEGRFVVHASIGSGGGVRALLDGVIDVGLISRPLTGEEARHGLAVTPYARVAVVVATHPGVGEECLSSGELVGLYSGMRAVWKDGGRVVVLQRERGDSSFLAMSRLVPGLSEANDAAYRAGRWRVLYDDRSMQEALVTTEGAVGIFDLGAIVAQRAAIRAMCVDGVSPSMEAVASGRYPFWKDLAFVTRGAPEGRAGELVAFALSAEGRALMASLGYVPLPLATGEAAGSGPVAGDGEAP